MEKILTISIAAYNVENYIRKTLDSLIDDSFIDDLEIFVVDDGGTDGTLDIAKEYAAQYPQSVFPIHKDNGGYGSTINKSIELATGKYFKQLDGDDWFLTGNLKELIQLMREVSVDCILTDYIKYQEKSGKSSCVDFYPYLRDGKYHMNQSGIKDRFTMYTSAFRTKILKEMPNRLTESYLYTDIEYSALPIPYIDTFYVFHKAIYVYRVGEEGQSINADSIAKHYREHEEVFWKLVHIYKTIPKSRKANREVFWYLLKNRFTEYYRYLCILPISTSIKRELVRFTDKAKKYCPGLLISAEKDDKLVKPLVDSHFSLYPVLSLSLKVKWKLVGH